MYFLTSMQGYDKFVYGYNCIVWYSICAWYETA